MGFEMGFKMGFKNYWISSELNVDFHEKNQNRDLEK